MNDDVYIKLNQNSFVSKNDIFIKDIADVFTSNSSLKNKICALKIYSLKSSKDIHVVSILDVIECILSSYPNVTVNSIGEMDCVIRQKSKINKYTKIIEYTKVAALCVIIFFGAAFAIMTFNTDVNTRDLFGKLYYQFTGKQSNGFTIIEISYSIGLAVGILVFYNHFSNKKASKDPTPLQVEMIKYDKDIANALKDKKSPPLPNNR